MGGGLPRFERLDWESVDWERLDAFPDRTIFQTRAWLRFVEQTQRAEPVVAVLRDGTRELGFFTGLIVRKFGLRILGSPFPGWTTSYMGFNLDEGVSRRVATQALLAFAFRDLRCAHLELMDRRLCAEDVAGLGFEQRIGTGFELDLTQSEDALFAKMSSACRGCIRKAGKSGVVVEEGADLAFADDYHAQLQDVFLKQTLVPTYSLDRVRSLIAQVHATDSLLLLRARDAEGTCIASGIFPAFNDTMYFWGGASWREHQSLRPNEAIQWYAMRYWKERGIGRYDMGGGGEYKRKYGGEEIAIPALRRSKYPWLGGMRNLAQRTVRARQVLLGDLRAIGR